MWSSKPFTGSSLPDGTLILSFDDGPGPTTLELAAYLAGERIQAIFFVVGRHVRTAPTSVTRLLELGHLVGNHSENHLHLTNSSVTDADVCEEFLLTDAQLPGPRPCFFRPPYGAWNAHLAHVFNSHADIRDKGAGPLNWDVDAGDHRFWHERGTPEACCAAYLTAIEKRRRGVVLCHDFSADDELSASQNQTFEMVRLLAPQLRERGFRFGSPSDLDKVDFL